MIVLCQEGYTSSLAAAALQDLGIHRATDVIGGFAAWRELRLTRLRSLAQEPGRGAAGSDAGVGVQAGDQQVDADEVEPERGEADHGDHGGPACRASRRWSGRAGSRRRSPR